MTNMASPLAIPLRPCPCGKTPEKLIVAEGSNCKWAYVSGDCCSEWNIEFRTNFLDIHGPEGMALAVTAWNKADRGSAVALFKSAREQLAEKTGVSSVAAVLALAAVYTSKGWTSTILSKQLQDLIKVLDPTFDLDAVLAALADQPDPKTL